MKWIYRFFAVLGVIFFCILIGMGYFIIADPFNIRPIIMSMYGSATTSEKTNESQSSDTIEVRATTETGETGGVSAGQAQALESIGINPESVPAEFTPEQEACFTNALGQERVSAIKGGAVPTPAEFYKAKGCL